MTPLTQTILGVVCGALITFCLNFLLNRLTKKQDRRVEWYDKIDKDLVEVMHRHALFAQQLEHTENTLRGVAESMLELDEMMLRLRLVEDKMGALWRGIEQQIAENFKLPPAPPRARR